MNLPNRITVMRTLLIPGIVVLMLTGSPALGLLGLLLFMLASFTDYLDGYLARKNNQVTDFGKFMDPIADKLLVTAVMVIMVEQSFMPGWMLIVFIAREFAVSGLRLVAASNGRVLAAGSIGKLKTFTQMIAIIWVLGAHYISAMANVPQAQWVIVLGEVLLYASLVLSVWSGTDYMLRNKEVFSEFSR